MPFTTTTARVLPHPWSVCRRLSSSASRDKRRCRTVPLEVIQTKTSGIPPSSTRVTTIPPTNDQLRVPLEAHPVLPQEVGEFSLQGRGELVVFRLHLIGQKPKPCPEDVIHTKNKHVRKQASDGGGTGGYPISAKRLTHRTGGELAFPSRYPRQWGGWRPWENTSVFGKASARSPHWRAFRRRQPARCQLLVFWARKTKTT